MKTGDIVKCVSRGGWERKVAQPNDKFLVLSADVDPNGGWAYVKVLHLKSGTKSLNRTVGRYRKV